MVDNGGFTIDGEPASTYGITLMYAPGQPMLPGTRDRTVEIPGRAGVYWFDSDIGPRTFSLPCQFQGAADSVALDVLIRTFARVLVHVHGRPRTLEIEFDDCPGYKYLVRYNGQIPFDRAWVGCSDFTLELIADDPYAYEPEDETEATITTSGETMTVTSTGNVGTPAKICITNNGANPIVGFTIEMRHEVY